jgi:hypothetical protein
VYLFGAVMAITLATFLDPFQAVITLVLTPILLLEILTMSGRVRFAEFNDEDEEDTPEFRQRFPTLAAVEDNDLTDTQAIEKYGMQLVQEMDLMITDKEAQLNHARATRDDFYDRVRGVKK